MDIHSYYNEFFNNEFGTRIFRSINAKNGFVNSMESNNPVKQKKNLIKSRNKFGHKLYYNTNFVKDGIKYYDRLFFDFDLENKEYKDLTTSSDARDMLFNSDILEIPFNEVSTLYDYLKSDGFNPYVIFTSSKGFHLYLFFEPTHFENHNQISNRFGESFTNNLNLKTLDFNVFTKNRLSRVPYSRHEKTDMFAIPCDVNSSIDEILNESLNPTIKDFHMSDYIRKGFADSLLELDKQLERLKEIEKEIKEKEMELQRQATKNIIYNNDVDLQSIDMRQLVRNVVPSNFVKSASNYDIYNCCFHTDSHHSAGCYEKRFYCASCNKSWNYYDFISEFFRLSDSKEIINEVKKHI